MICALSLFRKRIAAFLIIKRQTFVCAQTGGTVIPFSGVLTKSSINLPLYLAMLLNPNRQDRRDDKAGT